MTLSAMRTELLNFGPAQLILQVILLSPYSPYSPSWQFHDSAHDSQLQLTVLGIMPRTLHIEDRFQGTEEHAL